MANKDGKKDSIKEKKLFFNVFDIFLLLGFICIVSFVFIKFNKKLGLKKENVDEFCFTVEAKELDNNFVNSVNIKAGDRIYDSVYGSYYGEILNIKKKTSEIITEDSLNGTYVLSELEDKTNLEVQIKCLANINSDKICVGEREIRIGKPMFLKSKGYVITGYIIDMDADK